MSYLQDAQAALAAEGWFREVGIVADHSMVLTLAPRVAEVADDAANWAAAYVVKGQINAAEDITLDIIVATSVLTDETGAAATDKQNEAYNHVRAALHYQDFGKPDYYFEPLHFVNADPMGFLDGVCYWNYQFQLKTQYHKE